MALKDYAGAVAGAFGNRYNADYGKKLISNVSNRYNQGGIKAALTPQRAYAAEPAQAEDTNYVWQDNGTGGINYFYGGQPITNQQYMQGTGIDTNQLESAHYNEWVASQQGGGDTGGDTGTGGGGTGGGDAPATFAPHWVNGVQYNDIVSYTNAVTEAVMAEYGKQNKLLESAYQNGLLDFKTYEESLKQSRENAKQQYGDAMSSISGKFSALSPDVIQSSQGTSENRATDITNQNYQNISQGEADLGRQKTQYNQDYANNLASNQAATQSQIDSNLNQTSASISGTPYANQMNAINKPTVNTINPMGDQVSGLYDSVAGQYGTGNMAAVRSTIDQSQVDPTIKDWLYKRFQPQQV